MKLEIKINSIVKYIREIFLLIFLVVIVLFLTCTFVGAEERPIVILVSPEIEAYKVAAKGANEFLKNRKIITYTLDRQPERLQFIMEKISLVNPEAVIAIGSQAILALKIHPINSPVIFCLALNHMEALEIPDSWGISMHVPPRDAYEKIRSVFPKGRIGIPFNPDRVDTFMKDLVDAFKDTPIQLVPISVHQPSDLSPSLNKMRSKFDMLWIQPDSSIIDFYTVKFIIDYSISERVPLVGYSEAFAKNGAVLSLTGNYEDMGRQAAETALRVVSGETPNRIQPPRRVSSFLNLRVARIFNIPIGQDSVALADRIYPKDPELRIP